jgi:hypothetical protein
VSERELRDKAREKTQEERGKCARAVTEFGSGITPELIVESEANHTV